MSISKMFQEANTARSRPSKGDMLCLYAIGIGGESGEIQDQIKKHVFHEAPLDLDHVLEEVGDVLWYLDRLLHHLGLGTLDG
jgi:NTP pyrophosphatase (non-canonical NTP hydrolase)